MYNRHKDTQDQVDLLDYFEHPQSRRQRQYEAVRAFIKEQTPAEEVALRFGYTPATVYALVRDARAGKIRLFPEVRLGPKGRRTSEETKDVIIRNVSGGEKDARNGGGGFAGIGGLAEIVS